MRIAPLIPEAQAAFGAALSLQVAAVLRSLWLPGHREAPREAEEPERPRSGASISDPPSAP